MMLKSGVILATAATGLLVGAPLAYAACKDDKDHHHTKSSHHKKDDDDNDRRHRRGGDKRVKHDNRGDDCNQQTNQANVGRSGGGLVNVSNVNVAVPINVCKTDILSGALGILAKDLRNTR